MIATLAAYYRFPVPAWFLVLFIAAGLLMAVAAVATAIIVSRPRGK